MAEYRLRQVDPDLLEGLSLCLVNSHGKGRPYWELKAGELDRQGRGTWGQWDPGNENFPVAMGPCHDLGLDKSWPHFQHNQPCAVHKTKAGVQIPQQDDGHADLQLQVMGWQALRV